MGCIDPDARRLGRLWLGATPRTSKQNGFAAWIDDATDIHNGETKASGKLLMDGKFNVPEFLETVLRQVKVGLPGGFTSRRQQDRRYINFMVQFMYVQFVSKRTFVGMQKLWNLTSLLWDTS